MTAFVATEDGTALVQCWELTHILNEERQIQRHDGSTGVSHAVSLAAAGELGSVDIVTYPPRVTIFPPNKASTINSDMPYNVDM